MHGGGEGREEGATDQGSEEKEGEWEVGREGGWAMAKEIKMRKKNRT